MFSSNKLYHLIAADESLKIKTLVCGITFIASTIFKIKTKGF